jgi:hypothetical protein
VYTNSETLSSLSIKQRVHACAKNILASYGANTLNFPPEMKHEYLKTLEEIISHIATRSNFERKNFVDLLTLEETIQEQLVPFIITVLVPVSLTQIEDKFLYYTNLFFEKNSLDITKMPSSKKSEYIKKITSISKNLKKFLRAHTRSYIFEFEIQQAIEKEFKSFITKKTNIYDSDWYKSLLPEMQTRGNMFELLGYLFGSSEQVKTLDTLFTTTPDTQVVTFAITTTTLN